MKNQKPHLRPSAEPLERRSLMTSAGGTAAAWWASLDARGVAPIQARAQVSGDSVPTVNPGISHQSSPPGTVTTAYISAMEKVLDDAIRTYQRVGAASGARARVGNIIRNVEFLRQQLFSQKALIQPLMAGKVGRVVVAHIRGRDAILDRNALAFSDRAILAALAVTSRTRFPNSYGIASVRRGPIEVAATDPTTYIPGLSQVVTDVTVNDPAAIISAGTTLRNSLTAGLGGKSSPLGAVAYLGVTLVVDGMAAAVESTSKTLAESVGIQVSQQNQAAKFLLDSGTFGFAGEIYKEIQKAEDAVQKATTAEITFDNLVNRISGELTTLGTELNPERPGSDIRQVDGVVDSEPPPYVPPPYVPPPYVPPPYVPPPYVPPPQIEPVLGLSTRSLSFTAKAGSSTSDQTDSISIGNLGPAGSVLTYSLTDVSGGRLRYTGQIHPSLEAGSEDTLELSYSASGLQPGTYSDTLTVTSNAPGTQTVEIPITISVTSSQARFSGRFSGFVQNSSVDGSDPSDPFTDSYGGPASMSVTPNPGGGYTIQFSATLQTSSPHDEDFSANPAGAFTVSSLANLSFQFPMGDGQLQARGNFSNGTFSGTWSFVALDPTDQSDSGSGAFDLFQLP